MENSIPSDMIRGCNELIILGLLQNRDMYGYEIKQTIKAKSNEAYDLNISAIYTNLRKLEQKECIMSYEERHDSKIRVYYSITKIGHEMLVEKELQWNSATKFIKSCIKGN